jgi:hypothetical protein
LTLDLAGNEVLNLLYLEHITHSDSKLAAYYFLHALLAHAADTMSNVIARLPVFADSADPIKFASELLAYKQDEISKARQYTPRELSLHFLRELDTHSFPVQVPLHALEDLAPDAPVPKSLLITNLALVLAQTPFPSHTPAHVLPIARRLNGPSRQTLSPSSCPNSHPSGGPTPLASPSPPNPHPFRQREELQCAACGTWGHSAMRCSNLARFSLLQQYCTAHPSHATRAGTTWKELHSSTHRQAIARHLHQIQPHEPLLDISMDDVYEADFL